MPVLEGSTGACFIVRHKNGHALDGQRGCLAVEDGWAAVALMALAGGGWAFPGRTMRFVLSVLSMAALSGCASTTTSFIGPSGAPTHLAKCNVSPQGCYQEATKICRGPYQVLDSESHAGGVAADVLPGPVTWYGMTYSCGPSDGRLPAFAFKGPTVFAASGVW